MPEARQVKEQLTQLGSIVDKLIAMTGTARDAYNRHRRQCLEDLKNLQKSVAEEINVTINQVDKLLAPSSGAPRAAFLQLQSILSHLYIIADNIGSLKDPLQKKIEEGILFSDKAVSQINYLFDHQAGLLRSVVDIVQTNNEFLKKYVAEEGHKLRQACVEFATEHETRLIEGVCQPHNAPIFLAILDRMRTVAHHELEIARLMTKKS